MEKPSKLCSKCKVYSLKNHCYFTHEHIRKDIFWECMRVTSINYVVISIRYRGGGRVCFLPPPFRPTKCRKPTDQILKTGKKKFYTVKKIFDGIFELFFTFAWNVQKLNKKNSPLYLTPLHTPTALKMPYF